MPNMFEGKETIPGKTVLITGANSGIGKEAARELAKRGGRIIMACRNVAKGEEAKQEIFAESKNDQLVVRELDLGSLQSVQNFAKLYNETESRLDILINNAGVMACPKSYTKDGLEMQIGTNYFGHFLLTNLLLDKLKASAPSRIINVSSIAHEYGQINFDDLNSDKSYEELVAYNQSKLANVLHALELTERLKGTGVTANSLHPGFVDTALVRHADDNLLGAIRNIGQIPAVQGAQTTLRLALDKSLENVSGKYFDDVKEKPAAPQGQNKADAKRLWEVSEVIVQQKLAA